MNINVICLIIILSSVIIQVNSNVIGGPAYTRKEGFLLPGKPSNNITSNSETSCLIECESFVRCKYVNAIEHEGNKYTCQFFNCPTSFASHNLIEAENSTFFSVESSSKGKDCQSIQKLGIVSNGPATLTFVEDCSEMQVFCEMLTNGGGWIMLQRRFNGGVDFYRTWNEYRNGFGNLNGEFWLGLENAYQLMREGNGNITLRIDMWNSTERRHIEYYQVSLSDETDKYKLDWQGTTKGNAGDSMVLQSKNQKFSTKDSDNDDDEATHCANDQKGGWWFKSCMTSNLNGEYGDHRHGFGIKWPTFTGNTVSLRKTMILFKRQY